MANRDLKLFVDSANTTWLGKEFRNALLYIYIGSSNSSNNNINSLIN